MRGDESLVFSRGEVGDHEYTRKNGKKTAGNQRTLEGLQTQKATNRAKKQEDSLGQPVRVCVRSY